MTRIISKNEMTRKILDMGCGRSGGQEGEEQRPLVAMLSPSSLAALLCRKCQGKSSKQREDDTRGRYRCTQRSQEQWKV